MVRGLWLCQGSANISSFFFLMGLGNAVQQCEQMNAEVDSCRAQDMIRLFVYVNLGQQSDLVAF